MNDQQDQMQETMNQINGIQPSQGNLRDGMQAEITDLEQNLKDAEKAVQDGKDENAYTPISPEKANENKRGLVFLRKALNDLKNRFSELDK
jgi:predicted  nucleic acid-binding Zn-ribbon protein